MDVRSEAWTVSHALARKSLASSSLCNIHALSTHSRQDHHPTRHRDIGTHLLLRTRHSPQRGSYRRAITNPTEMAPLSALALAASRREHTVTLTHSPPRSCLLSPIQNPPAFECLKILYQVPQFDPFLTHFHSFSIIFSVLSCIHILSEFTNIIEIFI